mmetsp:Transcript_52386/g.125140  ORF Transcript_52386/g.125140 Transcript_52386/m.125140 type:complete len:90 (+) Transcript_52386:1291-1560(+)
MALHAVGSKHKLECTAVRAMACTGLCPPGGKSKVTEREEAPTAARFAGEERWQWQQKQLGIETEPLVEEATALQFAALTSKEITVLRQQ